MTLAAVVFFFAADGLADLFVGHGPGQEGVAPLAASLVRIVAFAQPFLAILMVFSGALRGAGKTRHPLWVNALGLLAVRLPLALFLAWPTVPLPGTSASLAACGLGVIGAWYAMAADLAFRGLGMMALFAIVMRDHAGPGERSGSVAPRRYT